VHRTNVRRQVQPKRLRQTFAYRVRAVTVSWEPSNNVNPETPAVMAAGIRDSVAEALNHSGKRAIS